MTYIVETRLDSESERWNPVIDLAKSKVKPLTRLFATENDAKYFCENTLKHDNYRITEVDDES